MVKGKGRKLKNIMNKRLKIKNILIGLILFTATVNAAGEDIIPGFSLPITHPKEIKEKSSLEEPALNRKMFLDEEVVKEQEAFYPSLFPERLSLKERHYLFFSQGSFDTSVFGFNSSLKRESGLYYQLGFEKDKSKGEMDAFSANDRNLIFQMSSPLKYRQEVSGNLNNFERISGDDIRRSAVAGLGWGNSGQGVYDIRVNIQVEGSFLYELEDWRDDLGVIDISGEYSPHEIYMVRCEASNKRETIEALSGGFRDEYEFSSIRFLQYVTMFDYIGIESGYLQANGNHYGQGRIVIPIPGLGQVYAEYLPGEELYSFRDSYLDGLRLQAYPGIKVRENVFLFSEGIKFRFMDDMAGLHLNIRHARVKNYLSWEANGEYLKPVFIPEVRERIYSFEASFEGGPWKPSCKFTNSDIYFASTGGDVPFVSGWEVEISSIFSVYGNDLKAAYVRESSKGVAGVAAQNSMGAYDIVSVEASRNIGRDLGLFVRGDNIFGKSYGDRPSLVRELPNFSVGLKLLF